MAYMLDNPFLVAMCAIIWPAQAIPMNFITMWLYNNFKYSHVLTLAACLQFCGAWLRAYASVTGSFWPILAGTTIMSLSASMLWQS